MRIGYISKVLQTGKKLKKNSTLTKINEKKGKVKGFIYSCQMEPQET